LVVTLFLLIYLIKTILLLSNKKEALAKFSKMFKVPEMIISTLFFGTGIYLLTQTVVSTLVIIKICVVLASIPLAVIGFKKENKALAILSFLFIFGAYGMGEANKAKKRKVVAVEVDVNIANVENETYDVLLHGKTVFTNQCVQCHGEAGTKGKDLTVTLLNTEELTTTVNKGRNKTMPAFGDALPENDIKAVISYIESLKK
jgi:cytochrome c5